MISNAGTWLISAQLPPDAVPGAILLPLIKTNVLSQPKFLRLAVAVPFEPFAVWAICPGAICGKSFSTSSILTAPLFSISAAVTTWTWEVLTIFGLVILEPVTTTSSTFSSESWATASGMLKKKMAKVLNMYLLKLDILVSPIK